MSASSSSPVDGSRSTSSVLAWLLLVVAAAILVAHSLLFNFVTDDAYISFVFSKNLAQHGQLVFNLGERVEGYTNFLWTVLLAGVMRLGVAPEVSSRVLGTLAGVLGLVAAARLHHRIAAPGRPLGAWDALPALVLAGVPGYPCWSSGGLETQLFTLLTTIGVAQYVDADLSDDGAASLRRSALALGLAALTRPEGYLFFGLCGAHRLARCLRDRRLPRRDELVAIGLFLLLTVPHVLFRRLYYGYWVPNTFYVKSAGGPGTWLQGGYYLFAFARDLKLWVLPLLWLGGLLFPGGGDDQAGDRRRRYLAVGVVTYLITGVFLLYVASVGGDFMGLYRFVLPIVPLNVVCGCLGLWRLLAGRLASVSAVALAALLGLHVLNTARVDQHALTFIGADRGIDTPGYLRYYAADRAAIGKWLGRYVRPDDFQVVGGAGAQVYYAGIRALDSFGLCDAWVAHNVPPSSTRPGHQKFAPLDYVLSRNPTIITYNVYRIDDVPYQPSYAEAATWRARGFHFVSVEIPGLSRRYYSFLKRLDRSLGPLPAVGALD